MKFPKKKKKKSQSMQFIITNFIIISEDQGQEVEGLRNVPLNLNVSQ